MKEIRSWNMDTVTDKYAAMRNSSKSMQDVEDETILAIDAWMEYEDTDRETGEVKTLLVIKSEGEQYTTISSTFIREFLEAWDFFADNGEQVKRIAVLHGVTKAGRSYVTCEVR